MHKEGNRKDITARFEALLGEWANKPLENETKEYKRLECDKKLAFIKLAEQLGEDITLLIQYGTAVEFLNRYIYEEKYKQGFRDAIILFLKSLAEDDIDYPRIIK